MAKLRKLDFNTCDTETCGRVATYAVDTCNGLYVGSFCAKHAKVELAKQQADEDAGNIPPDQPELTPEAFRALFRTDYGQAG